MKKMSFLITLLIAIFSFSSHILATDTFIINGYDVRFRSEPTTNSNIIISFNPGVELELLEKTAINSNSGCSGEWYKTKYDNKTGYVCSDYTKLVVVINEKDYEDYQDYLKELGFPEDYISSLVKLHAIHPNWKFDPYITNIDFNTIIGIEYDGHYKGWSLIEDSNGSRDGYKSFDSWSYNYLTDTFSNNFRGGGDRWYAASKKTIEYYMDPRNFLSESQIFMFETLSYNKSYHTIEGINLMLKGTFMDPAKENNYADKENQKTYADAFLEAAEKYQVSPYTLISRVIQEVGAQGSVIVSGTVEGYEGYYNFYNIEAAGIGAKETIENGLKKAVAAGWNTPYKAIVGGGGFISMDYIGVGQDTIYLQKWDLMPPNYSAHQYMQNIEDPANEAVRSYREYKNLNVIDTEFTFKIPIYKNMPESTSLPNIGNPNNYLTSLSINGDYLFKTANNDTEFNLNLSKSTTSVEVAATKLNSNANITGIGSVSLKEDTNLIEIIVTAANGDIRTYKVNITRDETKSLEISEILRIAEIKNDGTNIFGITPQNDYNKFIATLKEKETNATIEYLDYQNNKKSSNYIATGDILKITTDREEKQYQITIYGDVNADGIVDKLDYLQVLRHYYKYTSLDKEFLSSADVNKDGEIDKLDSLAILRDYYGYAKIEQ